MPLNNCLRGRTTQDRILASVVERLIAQIDELDESNCWLMDQPIPVSIPGRRLAVTVSLGPGRFSAEFFAGGGADSLVEDGSLVITPLVVSPGERPRRKWRKIAGENRVGDAPSLLYFKHSILRALLANPAWNLGDWEVSLDIQLESKSAYWHALNHQNGNESERELDLSSLDDWKWITDQVTEKLRGGGR